MIYWLAEPDPAIARVVLVVITSLTAPALYGFSFLLFRSKPIALLSGLSWAALPTSHRLAGLLLGEPLSALFLTLGLLLTVQAQKHRSTLLAGFSGLVLGYMVLTRVFLLPILIGPLTWLVVRRSRRQAVVLLVTTAVILGAWGVRNRIRIGTFTLTTQTRELWQGNNAWARGSWPGEWLPQQAYLLTKYPNFDQLDEVERSRLFVQEAVNEVASHPVRFLWLLPRKALIYFSPSSYLGFDWLYAGLLPFSLLGVFCLALRRERCHTLWLLGFPIIGVLIVCLLVFGDPRFRHPVDPLVVVLACVGLHGFISRLLVLAGAEHERK